MIGLIVFSVIAIYFWIGSWGYKGLKQAYKSDSISFNKYLSYLILAAGIGFIVTVLSIWSYSGEKINGFSFMAGYAIRCSVITLIPFLICLGASKEKLSLGWGYAAKVFACSLPFNVVFYFMLAENLASKFNIVLTG